MKNDRESKILDLLTKQKKAEVTELSKMLGVSQVTVRKDLDLLEQKHIIKRIHGYAELNSTDDINGRLAYHYETKKMIAERAAEYVHDIISWRINGMELDEIEQNDKTSEWLDDTIDKWVQGATNEERKTFVDEFFDSLAAGGAATMALFFPSSKKTALSSCEESMQSSAYSFESASSSGGIACPEAMPPISYGVVW